MGGSSSDDISDGSARNTYNGGPNGSDDFSDFGGDDGDANLPALAASDDTTYKGFTSGTGYDFVIDYWGTTDKLDLRPLETSHVYFDSFSADGKATNGNESLKKVINNPTSVNVYGHFSPILSGQENARIEQIIFSNQVVTSAAELNSLM